MRMKDVDRLRGGEILAEPVLTKQNDILIPKGTELKEEYVFLIQSIGLRTVRIHTQIMKHRIFFFRKKDFTITRIESRRFLKIISIMAREH